MAVDVKVRLDVDIERGIQEIKRKIKEVKRESKDGFDFEFGDIDDIELPDEKEIDVNLNKANRIYIPEKDVDVNLGVSNRTDFKQTIERLVDDAQTDVKPELDAAKISSSVDTADIDDGEVDIEPTLVNKKSFQHEVSRLIRNLSTDIEVGGDFSSFYGSLGAAKSSLSKADDDIDVGMNVNKKGGDGGSGSSGSNSDTNRITQQDAGDIKRRLTNLNKTIDFGKSDFGDIKRRLTNLKKAVRNSQPRKVTNWRKMRNKKDSSSDGGGGGGDGGGGGGGLGGGRDDDGDGGIFGKTKRVVSRLIPTFAGLYQAVAILLPAILGAAAQLSGLAIAAGGAAGAAAVPAILGLLGGSADSLAGSVAQMESRIKDMKQRLFGLFEPVLDTFSDDTGRVFDAIVSNASRLTDELAAFDFFTALGIDILTVLTTGLEDTAQMFLSMRGQLSGVAMMVAQLVATKLPEFLRFLVEEGISNINVLGRLGALVVALADFFYALFINVLNIASIFASLIPLINRLTAMFESNLVQSILAVVGGLIGFGYIISTISSGVMGLVGVLGLLSSAFAGTGVAAAIASVSMSALSTISSILLYKIPYLLVQLTIANSLLGIMATLLTIVTGGLVALGAAAAGIGIVGGIGSTISDINSDSNVGGGGFGGGGNTNINIEGNADDAAVQRIIDVTDGRNKQRSMGNGAF